MIWNWQPIETAPRNRHILVSDGVCFPPDVVVWHNERPAHIKDGNYHHAIPEGWFLLEGNRSRFNPLFKGHLMEAKIWHEIPEYRAVRLNK